MQPFGNMIPLKLRDKLTSDGDPSGQPSPVQKAPGKKHLELLLPFGWPDNNGPVQWCVTTDGVPTGRGEVSHPGEIEQDMRGLPLNVYVHAGDTSLLQVTMPNSSRKTLARAIPYALEDRLLGDVDQQFFTWQRQTDDNVAVCVISHERIRAILDALAGDGLHPAAMIPVTLSAPLLDNSWTLVIDQDNGWLRTGKYTGVACQDINDKPPYAVTRLLETARAQDTAPEGLLLIGAAENLDAEAWSKELGLEIFLPEGGFWDNLDRGKPSINLLHDRYTSKAKSELSPRKLWPAAAIGALVVVANVGIFGWQWLSLQRQASKLNDQMTTVFKQAFPEQAGTVLDPVAQMQSNLARLRQSSGGTGPSDFLALLHTVSKTLTRNPSGQLKSVQYRDNAMTASIQLANYQALDKLVKEFNNDGLATEVAEANSNNKGVTANIKITQGKKTR